MGYRIIRPANREEWLEERKKGIGSSDVGTIVNANPFSTPMELWKLRTGRSQPVQETMQMRAGHWGEYAVAAAFVDLENVVVDKDSDVDFLVVDEDMPFLRVSPDRLYWSKDIPEEQRTFENANILEIKTPNHFIDKDNIPAYWFLQCQYQMYVCRKKRMAIFWLAPTSAGHQWEYKFITFNPKLFNPILEKIKEFWLVNILQDVPPETVTNAKEAALRWADTIKDSTVVADDKVKEMIDTYYYECDQKKLHETNAENIKTAIATLMQDKEYLRYNDDTLATFKSCNPTETFDKDGLKRDYPEIYLKYMHVGAEKRQLRITPKSRRSSEKKAQQDMLKTINAKHMEKLTANVTANV